MKRGAAETRERDRLRLALAVLAYLCPDCPTRNAHVEWNGTRWIVALRHFESCVVKRHAPSRRACDAALADALNAAGVRVSQYNEDDLTAHR